MTALYKISGGDDDSSGKRGGWRQAALSGQIGFVPVGWEKIEIWISNFTN